MFYRNRLGVRTIFSITKALNSPFYSPTMFPKLYAWSSCRMCGALSTQTRSIVDKGWLLISVSRPLIYTMQQHTAQTDDTHLFQKAGIPNSYRPSTLLFHKNLKQAFLFKVGCAQVVGNHILCLILL